VLLFQVFLSAVAGVYNQTLLKDEEASLHAGNMMLYGSGVVINMILHITIRSLKDDEPAFFVGYNSVPAILVVLSNVFIGLAITAVYKCEFLIHFFLTVYSKLTNHRCRCSN
jgi:hypothetical protein